MNIEINKTYQHKNKNVVVTAIDAHGYCLCKPEGSHSYNEMLIATQEELLPLKVEFSSLDMGDFYLASNGDICVKINKYADSKFKGIVVKPSRKTGNEAGFLEWSKPDTLVTPIEVEINEKKN